MALAVRCFFLLFGCIWVAERNRPLHRRMEVGASLHANEGGSEQELLFGIH